MTVPAFHGNIGFNTHHAPMGAFFSFTVGHFGTRGGLGAQLGRPANQDVFIGIKEGARTEAGAIRCLPFFQGAKMRGEAVAAFTPEAAPVDGPDEITCYSARDMSRHYGWGSDRWQTPDFEFVLYTPFEGIPDPALAGSSQMRAALLPAVTAELTVDNRRGTKTKTAFFAINFNDTGMRLIDEGLPTGRAGFALRGQLGVAGEAFDPDAPAAMKAFHFMRWGVADGLMQVMPHLLGMTPGVGVEVPAGKRVTLRLAIGCYLAGTVTTRLEGRYFYTRYFTGLEDVLNAALEQFSRTKETCAALDRQLVSGGGAGANLNADQQFLLAHATRSYYGATQLLEVAGQPYWVVNEGEYCMMNTLDLSIDHMFWELEKNPWVVRNLLDNFVRYYSYHDQVKDPESGGLHPGGIAFCHDQGVHNQFSPFGSSSYELPNLTGCWSFMTQEEVCNWILLAASYVVKTGDARWASNHHNTIVACYRSMTARRKGEGGMMAFDSSRCGSGQEITSYDSLDSSLAQARANGYMSVKCWAAYIGLRLLSYSGADQGEIADVSEHEIEKLEWLLASLISDEGVLPAILEHASSAQDARILPAIEGLIYPMYWNSCPHAAAMKRERLMTPDPSTPLEAALRRHTQVLLSDQRRRNHFPDGGVRLSSTSSNSWASKIAIIEHVARSLFNLDENGKQRTAPAGASGWERSDAAHTRWQTEGASAYWACSDQMVNGVARGSKYYPRIITAALWLFEK